MHIDNRTLEEIVMSATSIRLMMLPLFAYTITAADPIAPAPPREAAGTMQDAASSAVQPIQLAQTGCSSRGGCR
ncbi:hypothetical protein ACQR16_10165 [Bradyrhizobium oligotrophicum]|uniref:hypothetical protein n=1 Tax=Bradyrhizobium oligotrophicum TaxID=44255 RepID=UPI003EC09C59